MTDVRPLDGLVLAIDASSAQGSAAVLRGARVAGEATVALRSASEERLLPAIRDALGAAAVDVAALTAIVCGAGPGSFTGLRIAAAAAKGIAMARGLPLYTVPSLALVVAGATDPRPGGYLGILDAMRDERFAQPIRLHPDGRLDVEPYALMSAGAAARLAADHGLTRVGPAEGTAWWPHARGAVRLLERAHEAGPVDLAAWQPDYGRKAEAQVKWEAAHRRALPVG